VIDGANSRVGVTDFQLGFLSWVWSAVRALGSRCCLIFFERKSKPK